MGVLADIYSGGNTLKRRLNALVDDPAGTLALGVTRFGEDQNELLNLLTNAYPMAGERTVLNSPERERHVFDGRIAEDGFSADQTGLYAKQAMQADSVVMPPSNGSAYPALHSKDMIDPKTGQRYNAMMPLVPTTNGFELITVIPKGLQKNKTPKR